MNSDIKASKILEDRKINVKIKIAALWGALMLIYIYVDIFGFYTPGAIESILAGKVWKFEITQAWAFGSLMLMMVPIVMIILSLILQARVNRWINIVVSALYVAVGVGTIIGETWAFYIVGHIAGILLLALIFIFALKWPKQETAITPLNTTFGV